ncbi:MAG: hypothetical protein Q4E67_03195, partial [Planctomycetia bacterium]|nr:hypothetical protein [Planctomycetia bacterium]
SGWMSGLSAEEKEAAADRFFAATLAFGHPGFLTLDFGMRTAMRGYFLLQPLHERYTVTSVDTIRYLNQEGKPLDTSTAIATDDYKQSQLVVKYQDGTVICVNGSVDLPYVTEVDGRRVELPPQGFTGWTADGKVYSFSGLQNGKRCDYAFSPEMIYIDGRGTFQVFEKACGKGAGVCRRMDAEHWEIIPLENAELGFAIPAQSAVALNHAGEEIGVAELRQSRGFTYVVLVKGAFSYRLKEAEKMPTATLTSEYHQVLPGEKVTVRGKADTYAWEVPADARAGTKIWKTWEGAWIDFEVVDLCCGKADLRGNVLWWEIFPNLPRYSTIDVLWQGKPLPPQEGKYVLDLGTPQQVGETVLSGTFSAQGLKQPWTIRVRNEEKYLDIPLSLSEKAKFWMQVRNQEPQENFGKTGAGTHAAKGILCSNVPKDGYTTHPPYIGGPGRVWIEVPCQVPAEFPTFLRAFVGKRDGCDIGDGILYEIVVQDKTGKTTKVAQEHVATHEWKPIAADLTPWKGEEIILQLITDCGEKNNTNGDWGCWGEIRLESRDKILQHSLIP